jgi:hypothetical protein
VNLQAIADVSDSNRDCALTCKHQSKTSKANIEWFVWSKIDLVNSCQHSVRVNRNQFIGDCWNGYPLY